MKKLLHFLVVLLGIFVAFILARLFIEIYTIVGDVYLQVDNKTITLYKVLAEIDYLSVGITFAMVFAYMLLLDLIVVVVVRSWFKIQNKSQNKVKKCGRINLLNFGFAIGQYILLLYYSQSLLAFH